MRALLFGLLLLVAVPPVVGSEKRAASPTPVERAREAVDGAVEFLLKTQNEDGSFGYHAQRSPFMIYAPVPGAHRSFRVASTSLALMSLLEIEREDPRLAPAKKKGIDWLVANAVVRRSHGRELYNCWAHGYGLKCIARYLRNPLPGMDEKAARATAARVVRSLAVFQMLDGGWGYFDFNVKTRRPSGESMTFTTATVLLALKEAREVGIKVPDTMVKMALSNLTRSRTPDGSFIYSYGHRFFPQGGINRPQGALTRNPGCHLARHVWSGGSKKEDLTRAVRTLLKKRAFARMALHRPVPHESWFSVSGYFYLYGYYYSAECLKVLPAEFADEVRDGMIEEILVTRHPDGSFWDYPLYGYHKPYGTGYALAALTELLRTRKPAPPAEESDPAGN